MHDISSGHMSYLFFQESLREKYTFKNSVFLVNRYFLGLNTNGKRLNNWRRTEVDGSNVDFFLSIYHKQGDTAAALQGVTGSESDSQR